MFGIVLLVLLVCGIAFAIILYFAVKNEEKRKAAGLPPGKYLKPTIAEVKYIGPLPSKVTSGGFVGAMIGDFLAGDIGMLVGGLAPRGSKTLYRFAVKYSDGKIIMEDCYKDSSRYVALMRFVNWDDL